MGTRYEDQPVEQWAGPESLDPTPVWKQYLLVALLFLVGLVVVVIVAVTAVAPLLVAPPALVFGDRLVLSSSDIPQVGAEPRLIATPLVDEGRSFYLAQPQKGELVALRRIWSEAPGHPACTIAVAPGRPTQFVGLECPASETYQGAPLFDLHGGPRNAYYRGLDRYLVSVSGDRVIVNLSRVIEPSERTSGPIPTGIPQPQTQAP